MLNKNRYFCFNHTKLYILWTRVSISMTHYGWYRSIRLWHAPITLIRYIATSICHVRYTFLSFFILVCHFMQSNKIITSFLICQRSSDQIANLLTKSLRGLGSSIFITYEIFIISLNKFQGFFRNLFVNLRSSYKC